MVGAISVAMELSGQVEATLSCWALLVIRSTGERAKERIAAVQLNLHSVP
jgi:hypothetical protein